MKHFKSLAIIGGSGMVGSDLFLYLKSNFDTVTAIDKKSYDLYRGHTFDVVINANGNSNKLWANEHILKDFTASTISVYQSLFDFPCKTYIYISSADVYENHTDKKFTKESENIDPENLTSYGFHKYLSECIVKNNVTDFIILRCPMMLGTKLKKGPIYDILNNSSLFISKESAFQMITTKELAQIIDTLLVKNSTKEVFNVGGIGTVLFSEITKYIEKEINFPKDGKTHTYEMNVSKLQKIYNLKTSAQYLKSFLKNYIILKS